MGTTGLVRLGSLSLRAMFYLHCTKKLLDRIGPEISPVGQSETSLGNWYATALFWKPPVAILVSERTLLPVLMPLAPAATLARPHPTGARSEGARDRCRFHRARGLADESRPLRQDG